MKHIRSAQGYTLIEVLVVIAIIGILAAVAIPQFAAFREQAFCSTVKSDLANLAIHQESYFIDKETYLAVTQLAGGASNVPNHRWTSGVILESATGGNNNWTAVARHPNCTQGSFTYDKANGGLQ